MNAALRPPAIRASRYLNKREKRTSPLVGPHPGDHGRGTGDSVVRLISAETKLARPNPNGIPAAIKPRSIPGTILLVEDCADDAFFMQRAMRAAGLKTPLQVVKHGRLAIEYLGGIGDYANRDRYPFPSLVLLDLKLPFVLGLDVLKWIRAQAALHQLPVVVLTASGEPSDVQRAYRAGANSFMVKPCADDLDGLAKCILQYWFTHSLLPPAV
jgi:CheY-like chemotaxis protein